ncbi:MAG TPA: hypothetical protein ENK32_07400 [Anaerolineae bacterium]|nr:hypothetical protein [Anaerolineae bacterium]
MNYASQQHRFFLVTLASMTLLFLGAAGYSFWADTAVSSGVRALKIRPSAIREIPQTLNLTITETGITAVTAADLAVYNWNLQELTADNIRLTRNGRPIPFYSDGRALYFLAEAATSPLEPHAVYQLSLAPGIAMAERDASPTGPGDSSGMMRYRWEEDSAFLADSEGDDLWYGRLLLAPRAWTLPLDDIQPNGGNGRLSVRLWSSTEYNSYPDHHMKLRLNGEELLSWKWDGIRQESIDLSVPQGILQPQGTNELTFELPGDTNAAGEAVYIDRVELLYESDLSARRGQFWFSSPAKNIRIDQAGPDLLVFDVSDKANPVALTGIEITEAQARFNSSGGDEFIALTPEEALRPSIASAPAIKASLKQKERGADYIAIIPYEPGFAEALQPLLQHRRDQGYRVTAVSLPQIYAEFGYGHESAQAIKDFLAYAASEWASPAPQFVLLAGDASYDLRDHLNGPNENILPSNLIHSAQNGYVSSDAWYGILDDSGVPQIAVGRFPAQTAGQLQNMVEKTIAYETTSQPWQQHALLVADDEPVFDKITENLAAYFNEEGLHVDALYMSQNDAIHYDIISALNKGVGLVNYAGHGGYNSWGDEHVFQGDDGAMLANSGRMPILTSLSCSNGSFDNPQQDSLAEELLWVENGGIVAAVAPTTSMKNMAASPLAARFYQNLLSGKADTIGEALLLAETVEDPLPGWRDMILSVQILGDPALRYQR